MMTMKRIISIFALISCLAIICGCHRQEKSVMDAETVLETFCRAMAAGDFDLAVSLCDTTGMKDYLSAYRQAWEMLQEKDSSTLSIASSQLAGSTFSIADTERTEKGKVIYYSLSTEERTKDRKALVRKEEGEWKVAEITDMR